MNNIREIISRQVVVRDNPAVYISGGIDSTIVLHHLRAKTTVPVYTYTAQFGEDDDTAQARRVAEYYGTIHKEVEIDGFIEKLPEILVSFDRPRYNVWLWFLAKAAQEDGRKTVYAGEGCDEHFGGYDHMNYLLGWANHIAYICPTYEYIHAAMGIRVEMPIKDVDWKESQKYFARNKQRLREAYRGIIPGFVVDAPKTPPNFTIWRKLWDRELSRYLPCYKPKNDADIRLALQYLVAGSWVKIVEKRITQTAA